ncbi:MAG: D-alanyl-D-alanine carboxypeptidase [Gemmatimonadetes bacterium]|jgi:D-alanyl-D-alanine carboxypeptidase (penicillin-binding protein 5/6)|nr:D-alanyl-D-alanine carboxypeptidase [Gemmatimonadota bacterium]MBT5327929.1 D-alanyl-D-alanine carboxypeptidase [Gemmatimonadota bacterium]MBT5451504.1 D-alanyl-D-alanine carboxypeptidase [Gemmatimonadota bacterium]MBT5801973.1 D-alanyl-D-alanine carboxypeptidase [Gemmatimonadota bacterium]MBT6621840.1 D-alanyl-D-alanine carboxypeptidase [Gemmatimonadota bacterium]
MPIRPFFVAVLLLSSALHAADFDPGEDPPYAAAILVEAESGTVLFAHNPDLQRSPASTQKLMLELVVMDLIKAGKFSLQDQIHVSRRAATTGGSQVFLAQGEIFPLTELMEAIVIPSANDACVAVAEHLGGSVEGFVGLMNGRAQDLGLQHTYSVNVHGLDDTPQDNRNLTTARDLSTIGRALLTYPKVLEWSSIRYKPFRNGEFMLYTTNKLLGRFQGLDGLKTGYTQRAGSCLVATAKRHEMRLVSVILGARGEKIRDQETRRLLSWGFNTFSKVPIVKNGELMGKVAVDWGFEPDVRVHTKDTIFAVLSPEQEKKLQRQVEMPSELPAPIEGGAELGKLKISLGDSLLAEVPIVAEKSVERMGLWDKLMTYF